MSNVQMNTRVPEDIKKWLDERAKAEDRDRGYILNKLIRPMMEKVVQLNHSGPLYVLDKGSTEEFGEVGAFSRGDAHLQQPLIPAPKVNKESGFIGFWAAYPKRKAKAEALKAWKKNDCYKIADKIIDDVRNRAVYDPSWADKQYVPNGSTYLNGKRWEDEIIQQDNRPKFQQQNDALRDELFGDDGAVYEHE